jgi:hypothetical protein
MPKKFLTPEEAREYLEWSDRRNAEIRAAAPPCLADLYARLFPPVSDEIFRLGSGTYQTVGCPIKLSDSPGHLSVGDRRKPSAIPWRKRS